MRPPSRGSHAPGGATGAKETRTPNIQLAKLALYQLSYNPEGMGLNGLEPLTPALSERCSNQLSYRPGLSKESETCFGDGRQLDLDDSVTGDGHLCPFTP